MKTLTLGLLLISGVIQAHSGPAEKRTADSTNAASTKSSLPSSPKPGPPTETVNEGPAAKNEKREAAVTSIEPEALVGFEHYAPQLQQLIRDALALTKLNLTYTFGASNPKQGGMDCSGTIWYLLSGAGLKGVPRQSNEMAGWVQSNTLLHRTPTADSLKHPEFSALQPGDLLFWSGTYETAPRKIPVTHVMLYLGKLKKSGRAVVFGASDGRVYQGERRTGVSVFDFSLPSAGSTSSFYGYGLIPGVGRIEVKPDEPILAKASTIPVKEPVPGIPNVTSQPAKKEDIRPAVVSEAKPASATMTNAQPAAAVRYTTRDEAPATTGTPKTASAATTASSTSTNPKTLSQSSSSSSKAKTKTSATTKPVTTKKKAAPPPPPPTPQEQLSKAAKKIGNTFKELFSN